jgi:cytochrome c oxidase subunit 4
MSAPTEHEHHVVGPKTYLSILAALLVLTADINMGVFSPIVALAIACLKAVLVILFFMHIRYSSRVMMLTVGAGFFTFLVLITMTLSDYISRNWGLW